MSTQAKITIIILSLIKLWLIAFIPLQAIGPAGHDDQLFVNLASSLIQGEWLGNYNHLTLAKGPMYSIWLAFNFYTGLPLSFAQHLLYLFAGLMLIIALRKIIRYSGLLVLLYALIIFSPHFEVRVIREGIYPALSILILAGLIGLYTHRHCKLLHLSLWSIFLGGVLAAFWLTREEGVWILPSILLMMTYILFLIYRTEKISPIFFKRAAIVLLPLFILLGSLQLVSLINKLYYDSYQVVDVKSKAFLSAYGALTRVKHPDWKQYLPVPKVVRQSIYQVSPAFKELEYFLEEQLKGWQVPGCRHYPETCGDIAGGWFMWVLRDAVQLAGYYQSRKKVEGYYLRLAHEINTACKQGLLNCLPERSTLIPPLRQEHINPFLTSLWQGYKKLFIEFKSPINYNSKSIGTEEQLVLFQDITREQFSPLASSLTGKKIITGWAFSLKKNDPLFFEVKRKQTEPNQLKNLSRIARHDVYSHFQKGTGVHYEQAKNSGFKIETHCIQACDLFISNNNAILAVIDLETKQEKVRFSDNLMIYIDAITIEDNAKQFMRQYDLNQIKESILRKIHHLYQLMIPWLSSLAIIAYLLSFIISLLRHQLTFLFILNTAIIGAITARLIILALINITSFPSIVPLYMGPVFPFLIIFMILAIIDLISLKYPQILLQPYYSK